MIFAQGSRRFDGVNGVLRENRGTGEHLHVMRHHGT
jgi:hypothetical protein